MLSLAPDTKVIVLTGQNDRANAVKAIGMGAYDFYAKPFEPEVLALTIERAYRLFELQEENRRLQAQAPSALAGLVTRDPEMLRICRTVEKIASANATVMLLGESGTGKELFARYLHHHSKRDGGPFLAVNCGAFNEELLANELFGHVKGAFTGAQADKRGLIAAANGGTLFLDEITEMSPAMQVKLLRVLQEREVLPLGATRPQAVDVRFVAATNRNLIEMV
jgi:two-component system NtrC family response regulator